MTNKNFYTTFIKQHVSSPARVLQVTTPHGDFTTPTFMPVGTRAAVNCMTAQELRDAGSQIILGGNTYHMLVSPGPEFIQDAGGMHRMMAWHGPMLTDSGGYQVFSLSQNAKICKIDEVGAKFKHPETGKVIAMTPNSSIETQKIIGADIIMAFDQCTPDAGGARSRGKSLGAYASLAIAIDRNSPARYAFCIWSRTSLVWHRARGIISRFA